MAATPPLPTTAHVGSARANVTIGEGADRVTVTIAATQHHVRVAAAAATPEMANALQRGAGELREQLRQHGLNLSELSAGTQGDSSSQPRPEQERQAPESRPSTPAAKAASEPETTTRAPRAGVRVVA